MGMGMGCVASACGAHDHAAEHRRAKELVEAHVLDAELHGADYEPGEWAAGAWESSQYDSGGVILYAASGDCAAAEIYGFGALRSDQAGPKSPEPT